MSQASTEKPSCTNGENRHAEAAALPPGWHGLSGRQIANTVRLASSHCLGPGNKERVEVGVVVGEVAECLGRLCRDVAVFLKV